MTPKTAPYGSWESPVTAEQIANRRLRFGHTAANANGLYWIETRPSENGRSALLHKPIGQPIREAAPQGFSVRTRAHEYGGGDFLPIDLATDGAVYAVNDADQRIYRIAPNQEPTPVTPENRSRCADAASDPKRNRIVCVIETHPETHLETHPETHPDADQSHDEPTNRLAAVHLDSGETQVLFQDADFVSSPRISPDGKRIAWLAWDHPNMPWDETRLWTAEFGADGQLRNARTAAPNGESIFQPEWSPDGVLTYVSDRSGWWNLYRIEPGAAEPVCAAPESAEYGLPQWVFGMRTYAYIDADRIAAIRRQNGQCQLLQIRLSARKTEPIPLPYDELDAPAVRGERLYLTASSPKKPARLLQINLADGTIETIRESQPEPADERRLSTPEPMQFRAEDGETVHAVYYPPCNPDFQPPPNERPPLIVSAHGGPTSAAHFGYNPTAQFFATRGFAYIDVNYGGSAGYGRAYRNRLRQQWGVVDVQDCANAALHAARQGLADPQRTAVRGGSAGGFTALAALAFRNVFQAGCSLYGISDLEALARETHKFESRYLDALIGPYPQTADRYRRRSPLHFPERFSGPALFLQGMEDKVVPPNQTEAMTEALQQNGIEARCILFEGEGHGFRQAKHIQQALKAELQFYRDVFQID